MSTEQNTVRDLLAVETFAAQSGTVRHAVRPVGLPTHHPGRLS